MTLADMLIGCGIMFAVTYATKAVGLLFVKKPIKNKFVKSFLYYLPYSVLAVMVFPAILFSTSTIWSGIAGSCLFYFVPVLHSLPSGVDIIVVSVVCTAALALLFPRRDEEDSEQKLTEKQENDGAPPAGEGGGK